MSWKPIVVGVDNSTAAAGAAALAERLAAVAATQCRLVHAVRDEWAPLAAVGAADQVAEMLRLQVAVARHQLRDTLRPGVSEAIIDELDVRIGPAPVIIQEAAAELEASFIVLGGKHHSTLERWLGGSTSLHVVRAADRPVLVTAGAPTAIRRVLAAADLSAAARPTLELAQRFARLVGAQLRVLSVFEPLPRMSGVPQLDPSGYYELSQELLQRDIWPLVRDPGVEKLVRHGMVVETLLRESVDWGTDLLVVGSHGKGWAQRLLLGSVTERLLNDLPASLLVAPIAARRGSAVRRRAEAVAV